MQTQAATGDAKVTLAWTASTSADVVGYNIYYGTTSGAYTEVATIGKTNRVTITGLDSGVMYFFTATAVNSIGVESPFSAEIVYTASALNVPRMQLTMSGKQAVLSGTGVAGEVYQVQATTNLRTWTGIGTVTINSAGTFQFMDTSSNFLRFYRLQRPGP